MAIVIEKAKAVRKAQKDYYRFRKEWNAKNYLTESKLKEADLKKYLDEIVLNQTAEHVKFRDLINLLRSMLSKQSDFYMNAGNIKKLTIARDAEKAVDVMIKKIEDETTQTKLF